jgi:hypothetical protein
LNLRPSGYEPDELPGCSTPRQGILPVLGVVAFVRRRYLWRPFGAVSWGARAARLGIVGERSGVRAGCADLWSGGDLLSHVLRRSTIGATGLNGRVRDGIGCFPRAVTTRPGGGMHASPLRVWPRDLSARDGMSFRFAFSRMPFPGWPPWGPALAVLRGKRGALWAPPLPDRIKPIERLVPVD